MFEYLKKILGAGPKPDLGELIRKGALILDVRTQEEFRAGHIQGSRNIPLQSLRTQLGRLNKEKVIIICCASGMRSA